MTDVSMAVPPLQIVSGSRQVREDCNREPGRSACMRKQANGRCPAVHGCCISKRLLVNQRHAVVSIVAVNEDRLAA